MVHDDLLYALKNFMKEEIYPLEEAYYRFTDAHTRKEFPALRDLRNKARKQGLWNLFLTKAGRDFGPGLTTRQYAALAEEMGRVPWASQVFNCQAPDSGNMEVLAEFGSAAQQEKWLKPLLEGRIRSAFLMTEPGVASSDARNIQTSIRKDGNSYIINGTKWWATGAGHPSCRFFIIMARNQTDQEQYANHSMVIVPVTAKGVTMVRPLKVMNAYDHPGGHWEVELDNVAVPVSNLLGTEGQGFEMAQSRLGPGRVHHCMRLIGLVQRSLEYACQRVSEREAFGSTLASNNAVRQQVAEMYCDLLQARMMTLETAAAIDRVGPVKSRLLMHGIKAVVPRMACRVIDGCMQLMGAKGLSDDVPLARFYTIARALRMADGPDEVHLERIGKTIIKELSGDAGHNKSMNE